MSRTMMTAAMLGLVLMTSAQAATVPSEICLSKLHETCHVLPCHAKLNAVCVQGQCVCRAGTCANTTDTGAHRCEADGGVSLGDRLVLERKWIGNATFGGEYDPLPLTATDADAQGWSVSPTCIPGRGREATTKSLYRSALNLWYDQQGWIIGYELHVPHTKLNHDVCVHTSSGGSKCAVMFRRPSEACRSEPWSGAANGSIGDRLYLPYWGGELPLTAAHVKQHSPGFLDTNQCLANMGHHYFAPLADLSFVVPMYYEKSGVIDGLLLADPIPGANLPSPPFEKFAEFANAMSLHVYFKDHMGACER